METPKPNPTPAAKPAAKKAPSKLPSKPISFSGQAQSKKGQKASNVNAINSSKKGGVNLMKKLSGM